MDFGSSDCLHRRTLHWHVSSQLKPVLYSIAVSTNRGRWKRSSGKWRNKQQSGGDDRNGRKTVAFPVLFASSFSSRVVSLAQWIVIRLCRTHGELLLESDDNSESDSTRDAGLSAVSRAVTVNQRQNWRQRHRAPAQRKCIRLRTAERCMHCASRRHCCSFILSAPALPPAATAQQAPAFQPAAHVAPC